MSAVEKRLIETAEASRASYKESSKNPWEPEGNTDPRTGRYSEGAIGRQMSCTRALGPEKAAEIASKVGAVLGQIYAPGFHGKIGNPSIRGS